MKKLTLIRHAHASLDDPDLSDFDRTLSTRGAIDAPRMGERLRNSGFDPDRILSSPALRARITASILAEAIGVDRIAFEESIYEAGPESLMNLIAEQDSAHETLMLVGQNPSLTDLCEILSRAGMGNIPPCGVVHLDLEIGDWSEVGPGCAKIVEFERPE